MSVLELASLPVHGVASTYMVSYYIDRRPKERARLFHNAAISNNATDIGIGVFFPPHGGWKAQQRRTCQSHLRALMLQNSRQFNVPIAAVVKTRLALPCLAGAPQHPTVVFPLVSCAACHTSCRGSSSLAEVVQLIGQYRTPV